MNEVKVFVPRPRQISRGPEINMDTCVENAGHGRFNLVLIASERLRELRKQHKESGKYITPVDALKDVEAGKVDITEYLNKIRNRHSKS